MNRPEASGRRLIGCGVLIVALGMIGIAAVGPALSSNMAFKLNKRLYQGTQRNPAGTAICNTCGNWVSMPFDFLPANARLNDICLMNTGFQRVAQTGLGVGFGFGSTFDPRFVDDLSSIRVCGGPPTIGLNTPYQPNIGVNIQLRTTVGDISHVFVGADRPGTQQLILNSTARGGSGICNTCGNWVQYPYHGTALRLNDICLENPAFQRVAQSGLATGAGLSTLVLEPERPDDVAVIRTCGGPPTIGSNPPLQMGKPVNIQLRSTVQGDVFWSPAHF